MKPFFLILATATLAVFAIVITFTARGQATTNAPPRQNSFLGFDRDVYPGDSAFPILRKNFSFTSYWLSPPPGEKTTTWLAKRDFLRSSGFGFLVLYRGRESRELRKDADGQATGTLDAQAAVVAAKKQGFPTATIIFLDIEEGGRLPAPYHAYLHAWADGLSQNGYRSGVYCSGMPAKEPGGVTILTADDIRDHAESRDLTFFVYNDACPPSPGCTFSGNAPAPSTSGVAYAQAWQYAQSPRRKEFTASCPAGYRQNGNCYSPGDTSFTWDLDVDTARSADPSNGAR